MSASLKNRTLHSIKWNAIGQTTTQLYAIFISIALARLLHPKDFGIIAMLFIFSEIANVFINSGFAAALIQKKDLKEIDLSTTFLFNITAATIFYLTFFFLAPYIADFYDEPIIEDIIIYNNLAFFIHAFSIVQSSLLVKKLKFKRQNLIQLSGQVISGLVALGMAYFDFGVYSLVGQAISFAIITTTMYWATSSWSPSLKFSFTSFKSLHKFGIKILSVSILDKISESADNLIIGKVFNAHQLGLYSRGKTTRDLPLRNVSNIITSIVFPVFSKIESIQELKATHNKYIGAISYIVCPMMVGLAILAKPALLFLYSEKWVDAAVYLQYFCIFALTYPLNSVIVSTIMSRGKLGNFVKVEIVKKIIIFISLLTGIYWGIEVLLICLAIANYANLLITMKYISFTFKCNVWSIFKNIIPGILASLVMGGAVYLATILINWPNQIVLLMSCIIIGLVSYLLISWIFKIHAFNMISNIVFDKFNNYIYKENKS